MASDMLFCAFWGDFGFLGFRLFIFEVSGFWNVFCWVLRGVYGLHHLRHAEVELERLSSFGRVEDCAIVERPVIVHYANVAVDRVCAIALDHAGLGEASSQLNSVALIHACVTFGTLAHARGHWFGLLVRRRDLVPRSSREDL